MSNKLAPKPEDNQNQQNTAPETQQENKKDKKLDKGGIIKILKFVGKILLFVFAGLGIVGTIGAIKSGKDDYSYPEVDASSDDTVAASDDE